MRKNHLAPLRRRPATALVGAAFTLAVAACGGTPDAAQTLDTVRSWTASTLLAARDRRDHAIGDRYAAGLRERASQALSEQRATLAKAARTAHDSAEARQATDSLEMAIERLRAETVR